MRLGTWIGIGLFAMAGVGCGGGSKGGGSFNDINNSFTHPTGMLAPTNADAVAMAYQTSLQSGLGSAAGQRLAETTSAVTESVACPNGGSYSINVSEATSSSVAENWSYNNCCETADCCLTGTGSIYYAAAGAAAGSFCESFDVHGTCSAQPVTESYSVCSNGTTGTLSYLVEVGGMTFAVSGNYSNGNGMLTITGANGTFSCTYTNNTGTCTGTTGSFSF